MNERRTHILHAYDCATPHRVEKRVVEGVSVIPLHHVVAHPWGSLYPLNVTHKIYSFLFAARPTNLSSTRNRASVWKFLFQDRISIFISLGDACKRCYNFTL